MFTVSHNWSVIDAYQSVSLFPMWITMIDIFPWAKQISFLQRDGLTFRARHAAVPPPARQELVPLFPAVSQGCLGSAPLALAAGLSSGRWAITVTRSQPVVAAVHTSRCNQAQPSCVAKHVKAAFVFPMTWGLTFRKETWWCRSEQMVNRSLVKCLQCHFLKSRRAFRGLEQWHQDVTISPHSEGELLLRAAYALRGVENCQHCFMTSWA